ncbi:MAG: hypothetical protein MRY63_03845 [Neomegalonema sp.]|nr:hypothetical protein [Neomegalonema sp.]
MLGAGFVLRRQGMSAKDPRKALVIKLDDAVYGQLWAYSKQRGGRSLAAAVRILLREPRALPPAPPRKARPLRLQLEPSLCDRLQAQASEQHQTLASFIIGALEKMAAHTK